MVRTAIPVRRLRGGLVKLFYISMFTSGLIFITYLFTGSDAKAIPPLQPAAAAEEVKHADVDVVVKPVVEAQPPAPQPASVPKKRERQTGPFYIQGEKYPKINAAGKFVPMRRLVHLDLKGAPYKVEFFSEIFYLLQRIGATGIVLEWEDMFPYTGELAKAINRNAYSMQDVEMILNEAKRHKLEIIPLVQTVGHLEWILKLDRFKHMREDPKFPMVICFAMDEAWNLIKDMIRQVAEIHRKYDMPYFHMGADEVFQLGICKENQKQMMKLSGGSTDHLLLWHISRTASHIGNEYNTTVLAWHDMFAHVSPESLDMFNMTELLEPVLWNYAEDLNVYLPYSTWMSLTHFPRVWGGSAWKGADGPARYQSHPAHYIANHQSWTDQLTRVHSQFEVVQGMIMSGWSRYDHLALLAELLPIAIPSMVMSMETITTGDRLDRYPKSAEILGCEAPVQLGQSGSNCRFPGSKIYELINSIGTARADLRLYRDNDYELNGWLSRVADRDGVSSTWYLDKVMPIVDHHAQTFRNLEKNLRFEMSKIYFQDDIDEFIFTYMGDDLEWLDKKQATAKKIYESAAFPRRFEKEL